MATFRMHYAVPLEGGPIVSDGGPEFPPEIQDVVGQRLSQGGTFIIACDPTMFPDGLLDRFTNVPSCVMCPRCKKTEFFRRDYKLPLARHQMLKKDGPETEDDPI